LLNKFLILLASHRELSKKVSICCPAFFETAQTIENMNNIKNPSSPLREFNREERFFHKAKYGRKSASDRTTLPLFSNYLRGARLESLLV